MARTADRRSEPRVQITLQIPQTVYAAIEGITRQGERHGFILDIIERNPFVAAEVKRLEEEAARRAKFEELGRKAVEEGVAVLDS